MNRQQEDPRYYQRNSPPHRWENSADHSNGFVQYVCIKGTDGKYYYYGHLSELMVKSGQSVKITDVIGIEGPTGKSTGSHCHYCIHPQFAKGNSFNVSEISGIPNPEGGIFDDGFRQGAVAPDKKSVSHYCYRGSDLSGDTDGKKFQISTFRQKLSLFDNTSRNILLTFAEILDII